MVQHLLFSSRVSCRLRSGLGNTLDFILTIHAYFKASISGGFFFIYFLEIEKNNNDSHKYDVEVLKNFYTQNDFNLFGERISDKKVKLYQLVKAI